MPDVEGGRVEKRDVVLVFLDDVGGELTINDFAEDALFRRDACRVSDFDARV